MNYREAQEEALRQKLPLEIIVLKSMGSKQKIKKSLLKGYDKANEVTKAFIDIQTKKLDNEINKMRWMLKIKDNNELTDGMIQHAREYPITNLIDFNNGVASAWCHEDKTPSLKYWERANRARCFVCNLTFNPIDVLMERDGMNFYDAVKRLQ